MTKREKFVTKIFSAFSAVVIALTAMSLTVMNTTRAETENFDEKAKDMAKMVVVLINEARENAVYCPSCGFINDGRDAECLDCHASLEGAEDASMKPLYIVPYLNDKARERARELISKFDHTRPDGSKWSSIIDGNIIYYSEKKENIANVYSTAESVYEAWKASPKHWANMMNRNATITGVGVAYEPNDSIKYYWEQIFVLTSQEFENWYIPQKYDFMPSVPFDLNQDDTTDPFDYVILENFVSKRNSGYPVSLNPLQIERANYFKDRIEDQNKPENNIDEYDLAALKAYLMGAVDHLPCTIKDLSDIVVFLEEPEYAGEAALDDPLISEPPVSSMAKTEPVVNTETTAVTTTNIQTTTAADIQTTEEEVQTTTAKNDKVEEELTTLTALTTVVTSDVSETSSENTTTAKTAETTDNTTVPTTKATTITAAAAETTIAENTTTTVVENPAESTTTTSENDDKNSILKTLEERIKALQEIIEGYKANYQ